MVMLQLLKAASGTFVAHNAPRLAAALSFYALFSLTPLVIIVLGIAGLVLGSDEARVQLLDAVQLEVGEDITSLLEGLIDSTISSPLRGTATLIGTVILFFAATGFFTQLQSALHEIWQFPGTRWRGVRQHLFMRVVSLGMILLLGVLLLVSVALQAAVSLLFKKLFQLLPGLSFLLGAANQLLSVLVFTLAFVAFFRVLTYARVNWREVFVGSFVTAVLFRIGLALIGLYLRLGGFRSAFGAVGSIMLLLLWIYYSLQIVLFGAAFTKAYGAWRSERKSGLPPGSR